MKEKASREEVQKQREYYTATARRYNDMHVTYDDSDPHYLALAILVGTLEFTGSRTVLDVGSGTGRAVRYIQQRRPDIEVVGVEPVADLRRIGHASGIPPDKLIDGDATCLNFDTDSFDVVCAFGVLHHVPDPATVVREMLRVARRAILISDSNNFGQGTFFVRALKQVINACGMWKVADFVKTRGRGYMMSDEEGVSYSYSVYSNYQLIESACKSVHVINTDGGRQNYYRTARHVALLGIKK